MDKLLYVGGLGWLLLVLKARACINDFMGLVKGTDGFLLMVVICTIALICVGTVLLIGGKRKAV